jgi:hypothetical protein
MLEIGIIFILFFLFIYCNWVYLLHIFPTKHFFDKQYICCAILQLWSKSAIFWNYNKYMSNAQNMYSMY